MFEDYYGVSDTGLLDYLLAGGQGLPTEQPVVPVPVPAEQSLPTEQPVVAVPASEPPAYTLPTPQPVEAQAVTDGVDWAQAAKGMADFLAQGQGGVNNTEAVNKWIAEQAAQGREYIYDPNKDLAYAIAMNAGAPLMSNIGGPTYSKFDPNNPTASMAEVFRFTTDGGNHPVTFTPGMAFNMVDPSGKTIASASTPEEMRKLVDLSKSVPGYTLQQTAGQDLNAYASGMTPTKTPENLFKELVLPMLAIAGAGFGLSALGLGGGAGGAAGAAGAGAAGAMPSVGSVLANVGTQLAGTSVFGLPAAATTAGTLAAAAAPAAASGLLGEVAPIVVTGAKTAADLGTLATVLGAPTAAGLANLANSVSSFQPPVEPTTPPSVEPTPTPAEEIVVEAAKKPPLDIFDIMTLPASTTLVPNTSTITEPSTVQPQAPDEIVVEGTRQPPPSIEDIMTLPASTTLAPNTSTITEPSTVQPEAQQDTLLRDIMRYYSLGSGLLDALGVGKGGGTTTATPYTSTLGVLPTFGRGPFTPFQGDYETYGQGPEWNFFGGK